MISVYQLKNINTVKEIPVQAHCRADGFQEFEAARFRDNRHRRW